jgi:hypothetical protein
VPTNLKSNVDGASAGHWYWKGGLRYKGGMRVSSTPVFYPSFTKPRSSSSREKAYVSIFLFSFCQNSESSFLENRHSANVCAYTDNLNLISYAINYWVSKVQDILPLTECVNFCGLSNLFNDLSYFSTFQIIRWEVIYSYYTEFICIICRLRCYAYKQVSELPRLSTLCIQLN